MENAIEILKKLINSFDKYCESNPEHIATEEDLKNPAYLKWVDSLSDARKFLENNE